MNELCFTNANMFWGGLIAETFYRAGGRYAVIAPGSRSAPLAIGFGTHDKIDSIPHIDERSAAFFALGIAKRTGLPTALICTSGTAAANFFPAIVEAHENGVPLLVLTADRPPELRDCQSGQAIDQQKLYGDYVNHYAELATPLLTDKMLGYLRQTVLHAVERSLYSNPGPVHMNVPFRDPLAPVEEESCLKVPDLKYVDDLLRTVTPLERGGATGSVNEEDVERLKLASRAVLLLGAQNSIEDDYLESLISIADELNWPVLDNGISGLRNHASKVKNLITNYDQILRNKDLSEALTPNLVLSVGSLPVSKPLRKWLSDIDPEIYFLSSSERNLDGIHSRSKSLRLSALALSEMLKGLDSLHSSEYTQKWLDAEKQKTEAISKRLSACDDMFEGKLPWLMSRNLQEGASVFVSSSMPIRDLEYFWGANDSAATIYANRGANGIDGIVSTAAGVAHGSDSLVYLISGDLAFLHDSNGLLCAKGLKGSLTIFVINNEGGGIFDNLPISEFEAPFEEYFITKPGVDIASLAKAHNLDYRLLESWAEFEGILTAPISQGIRIVEIKTDRASNKAFRKELLNS